MGAAINEMARLKEPTFVHAEFADGFEVIKRGAFVEIIGWKEWTYDAQLGVLATERVVVSRMVVSAEVFERDANRACQHVLLESRKFINLPGVSPN